ncbi:MAG: HpcH/HpaI aldolase/citrate lyase family protein, partial [Gemmatimonadales bacterium]
PGRLRMLPLIESARGLLAAAELALTPRVARLGIGEADLIADLRMEPGPARGELLPRRLQVVTACAAAGIGAPVAPTSTDFRDLAAFRQSTQALVRLGFRARTAIHPAQVAAINEILSPSAQDIARARRLVTAFEAARSRGDSVTTDEDGRMVDVAVVRAAREVLVRAGRSPGPA